MLHTSVLLREIVAAFERVSIKAFVDCTLGAGGHAEAILANHPEIQQFFGIDQDPLAREIAAKRLAAWENKLVLIPGNFRNLSTHLSKYPVQGAEGILLDLGVSSMQLDLPEKGFSFSKEGPLDMRMDPNGPLSAEEIVNTYTEQALGEIFRNYGEEKQWRLAAYLIVQAREKQPLKTTFDLERILTHRLRAKSKKGIHPLTLVFQGLRIAVNDELRAIEEVLPQALKCLNPGGRLAVISFHSLEDRIVKNYFRYEADDKENTSGLAGLFLDKEPSLDLVSRKPIVAQEDEVQANPRSRSAKLRVVQKR